MIAESDLVAGSSSEECFLILSSGVQKFSSLKLYSQLWLSHHNKAADMSDSESFTHHAV